MKKLTPTVEDIRKATAALKKLARTRPFKGWKILFGPCPNCGFRCEIPEPPKGDVIKWPKGFFKPKEGKSGSH